MDVLATAEELKNELDALRPLNAEAEARIMQKFRLDWNYHSNHLEGNFLTYSETTALVLHDRYIGDKSGKDYREMRDHNEVIKWIEEISKEIFPLTEVFIRQIHELLLKRPYFVYAETSEGVPTKRRIEVGKYKTQPNHVLTQTGETFYFATPEETPAKMQELVEWFRKEKEKPEINPIILAALFHYKFIRIHPFDDGNGRVARILMNFILMQYGFPPVIIKTGDKENYFSVLQQADAEIFEPFIKYIAQNLIRSLELMVKGAKGESIEEPDDLNKKIALLDKRLERAGKKLQITKGKEIIEELFEQSIKLLARRFIEKSRLFETFYVKSSFSIVVDGKEAEVDFIGQSHFPRYLNFAKSEISDETSELKLKYEYETFSRERIQQFDYNSVIGFSFGKVKYYVVDRNKNLIYEKFYSDQLTEEEIENIIQIESNIHLSYIEKSLQNLEESESMSNWLSSE